MWRRESWKNLQKGDLYIWGNTKLIIEETYERDRSVVYIKNIRCTFFQIQKPVVTKADKEACSELGFLYYTILAKMHDLDPKADKKGT